MKKKEINFHEMDSDARAAWDEFPTLTEKFKERIEAGAPFTFSLDDGRGYSREHQEAYPRNCKATGGTKVEDNPPVCGHCKYGDTYTVKDGMPVEHMLDGRTHTFRAEGKNKSVYVWNRKVGAWSRPWDGKSAPE